MLFLYGDPGGDRTRHPEINFTNYNFRYQQFTVCGLDFAFTMSLDLGVRRQVSTPSLTGLARRCLAFKQGVHRL